MNILVTTGNTQTPIDHVRCITNIFTGRTGARIALEARRRGHSVCLLTSHPEAVEQAAVDAETWRVAAYRTFDDLRRLMEHEITTGGFDAIVHSAAVSDYSVAGVLAPTVGTSFDPASMTWRSSESAPRLADVAAGKVKSRNDEVWLRLVKTPKLVDMIREPWGFRRVLVKFKLEVGVAEAELRAIAERSREQSDADLIVANTLETMREDAYFGGREGTWRHVPRPDLAPMLMMEIEELAMRPR